MKDLNEIFIADFQESLLEWFRKNGREYPWRKTRDPYSILILEKLLQQTSVRSSIVDIYSFLLQKYPTVHELALAEVDQIRALIKPLGLHYRANDYIHMAQEIRDRFGGIIPTDLQSLLSIYGIGDYTARAILCFAYLQDVPVVDTNIARILIRVLDIPGKPPTNPSRNRNLIDIMEELIPIGNAQHFNWGLIDLGAFICKSTNPRCGDCPLKNLCAFFSRSFIKIEE